MNKLPIVIILIALFVLSCHKADEIINVNENNVNHPPHVPSNPVPADLSVLPPGTHITFEWNGGDPDQGDTVSYDIYLDTLNPPQEVLETDDSLTIHDLGIPGPGTYFWRVIAKDFNDSTATGPVWRFTITQ